MTLQAFFEENPSVAIAFSGGVDSAYLLYAAKRYARQVKAYYVQTAFQPQFEREDARRMAAQLDVPLQILPVEILSVDTVAENPADRCYHCKKALFYKIMAAAKADGFSVLLDGTNASDEASDRPGMRALAELSVRSPLRECGLTKDQIRRLSKEAGLFTHEKPAYACLATRIPTGERIAPEKLFLTEAAETYLHGLGFRDFRVRSQGDIAKIQLRADDLPLLFANRAAIVSELNKYYSGVLLDLEVRT